MQSSSAGTHSDRTVAGTREAMFNWTRHCAVGCGGEEQHRFLTYFLTAPPYANLEGRTCCVSQQRQSTQRVLPPALARDYSTLRCVCDL